MNLNLGKIISGSSQGRDLYQKTKKSDNLTITLVVVVKLSIIHLPAHDGQIIRQVRGQNTLQNRSIASNHKLLVDINVIVLHGNWRTEWGGFYGY